MTKITTGASESDIIFVVKMENELSTHFGLNRAPSGWKLMMESIQETVSCTLESHCLPNLKLLKVLMQKFVHIVRGAKCLVIKDISYFTIKPITTIEMN